MEQNRPIWPWIVGTLLGAPILYFFSLAPLIWLHFHDLLSEPLKTAIEFYAIPIRLTYDHGPALWQDFLQGYEEFCRG